MAATSIYLPGVTTKGLNVVFGVQYNIETSFGVILHSIFHVYMHMKLEIFMIPSIPGLYIEPLTIRTQTCTQAKLRV